MYRGVQLQRFEGTLVVHGKVHTFTPFPQWVSAKNPYLVPINKNHKEDGKYSQTELS
jgi:hypothetical protein